MAKKNSSYIFWGIALGVIVGYFTRVFDIETILFATIGDFFIRLLKMLIAPLILASVVTGITSLGSITKLEKVGGKTLLYYLATTFIALLIGLILVNILQPGKSESTRRILETTLITDADATSKIPEGPTNAGAFLTHLLRDTIKNPFQALAHGDILSIILFSILLGWIISSAGEKASMLVTFFENLNEVMLRPTNLVMKVAPIGVFALMADVIYSSGLEILGVLGKYMITVLLGLIVHGVIVLPLILKFFGRMSILRFFREIKSALAVAFTTSSSSATLPITIRCVEKNLGVSNKTAGFVLPLGSTLNMDGTALYEAVAALFIAQVYGIDLHVIDQVVIFLTATVAAIGAPGIPSAGTVTMLIVLNAVNLPIAGIALVLGVDRILDMCRTTVNVLGDAVGSVVVARSEGERFNNAASASGQAEI